MNAIMTREHPAWNRFCELLGGPEGCDFRADPWHWRCDHSFDRATAILQRHFPDVDVQASCDYFREQGGYCDCEILLNIDIDENSVVTKH